MQETNFIDRAYRTGRSAAAAKLSGVLGQHITDLLALPTDVVNLLVGVMTDKDVPTGRKLDFVFSVVYYFLPFDLMPDKWKVVGKLDDAYMSVTTIGKVLKSVDREILLKYWQGDPVMLDEARDLAIKVDEKIGSGLVKNMLKLTGKVAV